MIAFVICGRGCNEASIASMWSSIFAGGISSSPPLSGGVRLIPNALYILSYGAHIFCSDIYRMALHEGHELSGETTTRAPYVVANGNCVMIYFKPAHANIFFFCFIISAFELCRSWLTQTSTSCKKYQNVGPTFAGWHQHTHFFGTLCQPRVESHVL